MIYLVASYKPYSIDIDETIRGIAIYCGGERIGSGTFIPTSERDLEFRFQHPLSAILMMILLEQDLSNIHIDIDIFYDDNGKSYLAVTNHPATE